MTRRRGSGGVPVEMPGRGRGSGRARAGSLRRRSLSRCLAPWTALTLAAACVVAPPPRSKESAHRDVDAAASRHGSLEVVEGLRVLRLRGTATERGYAHGALLADDIARMMRQEFAARFAAAPQLLEQARAAMSRLIEYPEDIQAELDALWRGVLAAGADLEMPALGRPFDRVDLGVANALDVFGLMGCSGFTVWGEEVAGGGVLTARNFDWPLTGGHMLDQTLLIVQEHEDGRQVASLGWPGYVGTVTGVSGDGVAASLHVGSARFRMPEPSSWPASIAARKLLESPARGEARLAQAQAYLEYTSPPVGFLTHVVLPRPPADAAPAVVFEADARRCVRGRHGQGALVVTNHFLSRQDGRAADGDSLRRQATLQEALRSCSALGDRRVDVDEAWRALGRVEAGGGRYFGTLHALVFRHDPWVFEVRVASLAADGALVAAPRGGRRHALSRAQVFGRAGGVRGAARNRDAAGAEPRAAR